LTFRGQSALLAVCAGLLGAVVLAGPVSADQVQLVTGLSGGNEVPGPGDPNGSGTATLTVDTASGQICYQVNVSGLSSHPSAAQILHGDAGTFSPDGRVTINLAPPINGSSSDCVTIDTGLAANGIATYPSAYFLTVATPDFPQGAVRGQLGTPSNDHPAPSNDHPAATNDQPAATNDHGVSAPDHTNHPGH
jgi:hypothetical protein